MPRSFLATGGAGDGERRQRCLESAAEADQVAARVGEILDQRQQELHRQRVALESER